MKPERVAWFFGAIAVALVACAVHAAESSCYAWTNGFQTASSPAALAELVKPADVPAEESQAGEEFSVGDCEITGSQSTGEATAVCKILRTLTPPTIGGCEAFPTICDAEPDESETSMWQVEVECGPQEEECSSRAGQERVVGGDVALGSGCVQGCAVTSGLGAMRVTATGVSPGLRVGTFTGAACTSEDEEAPAADCISGSFGRVCASKKEGKNCGTFNGDRVCLEAVGSGCKSFSGGGTACVVEGAGATEQVPDDGTPGSPATPDMQVKGGGRTVNYYSSSTVANSSAPIQSGNGEGDDGDGTGDGVDLSCGGSECRVTMPGELEQLEGVEGATGAFLARVEGSPLMSALGGVSSSVPAGTCSFESFEVLGEEYSFDVICDFLATMLPLLRAAFLFGACLLAVRTLMSA